jgi:hypothetical protein
MNTPSDPATGPALMEELKAHLAVCEEMLALVSREREALQTPAPFPGPEFARQRNALLPRLTRSLDSLSRRRAAWVALPMAVRTRTSGADALMQRNQELIMRIIVLDRENEQTLLRRGLLPPGHLPASQRQRPQLVARCYLQNLPA